MQRQTYQPTGDVDLDRLVQMVLASMDAEAEAATQTPRSPAAQRLMAALGGGELSTPPPGGAAVSAPSSRLQAVMMGEPPPQAAGEVPTLGGPRRQPSPLLPVPPLPPSPDAVPRGQGLQPQSAPEQEELSRDAQSAGVLATAAGIPQAYRGSRNLQDAIEAGDPVRGAAAVGQTAMAALPYTRLAGAMLRTPTRAVGTGVGMGGVAAVADNGLVSPAQAQGRSRRHDPAIEELQRSLKSRGLYDGPIDGSDGPETKAAMQRAREAETQAAGERRRQQDIEGTRAAAEAEKAKADADRARSDTQETERLRLEGERKAQQRQQGKERLREVDKNTSALQRLLRAYGPYAGYGIGGGLGWLMQRGMFRAGDAAAQTAATRADALMTPTARGVPARVGRVNQFWAEGQPGRAQVEPFNFTPGRKPQPYTVNPDAPPASSLYQPTTANRIGERAVVPATGAADWGIAELGFAREYRQELTAAQEAVAKDPSEANIQRLEAAKNKLALAELFSRIGQGAMVGSGATSLHHLGDNRARPNVSLAETERGRLVNALKAKRRPARKGGDE